MGGLFPSGPQLWAAYPPQVRAGADLPGGSENALLEGRRSGRRDECPALGQDILIDRWAWDQELSPQRPQLPPDAGPASPLSLARDQMSWWPRSSLQCWGRGVRVGVLRLPSDPGPG